MTASQNNLPKNAGTKRNWRAKPATVTILLGAGTTTIVHEGQRYDATNGDQASMTTVAANICQLCGIGA